MRRAVRAALITLAIAGPWWGAMAWWATFAPDPIVPKVLALGAVPVALILFVMLAVPPGSVPEVSPEELEYQRYIDSWTPPPPPETYYVSQRDHHREHQEHLADQARMFYLFGRDTPPTDWYPR